VHTGTLVHGEHTVRTPWRGELGTRARVATLSGIALGESECVK
jgi:hypothetical protein